MDLGEAVAATGGGKCGGEGLPRGGRGGDELCDSDGGDGRDSGGKDDGYSRKSYEDGKFRTHHIKVFKLKYQECRVTTRSISKKLKESSQMSLLAEYVERNLHSLEKDKSKIERKLKSSLTYSKPYTPRIDSLKMSMGYQPPKFQQFDGKGNLKQHVAYFIETCNNAELMVIA
ncbi:hypothetical protein Sango_2309200 [Sesamum angolense]|uniref:Uncharacterized protein n=1 Tax=Sesamum angolense TaxID=2727404 RepID=A0AAE1WAD4_9LAMI|nr:hypothetical protein Sango_2309200 [Sesamum angolense]